MISETLMIWNSAVRFFDKDPYLDLKVLGIIPARGGSKSIPRKNIRDLCGKPLIAWTIEAAKKSNVLDRVIVSTEDDEIANVALSWGADVPVKRPIELAQDHTPGIDVVIHAIEQFPDFDAVLLLQPTSPLRTNDDINGILDPFFLKDASSAVSFCEASVHPFWVYKTECNKLLPFCEHESISCRQDLPTALAINGALYFSTVKNLIQTKSFINNETIPFIMPQSRSLDIDDEIDFVLAEKLLENAKF